MNTTTKKVKGREFDWYSDQELLEIFPEAKELIYTKIRELEKIIKKKESEISNCLDRIKEMDVDDFSKWFAREIVKMELMPELQKYDKELFHLRRYERILKPNTKRVSNFHEKVEIAKNASIVEVAIRYTDLKPYGNKFTGLCPLHEERRASFVVYPETNSFFCFGCSKGGSVINLIMELHGVDFKDAVLALQN